MERTGEKKEYLWMQNVSGALTALLDQNAPVMHEDTE